MEENNEELISFGNAVHIAALIHKVREGELLTDPEQQELDGWLRENDRHVRVYKELMDRKKVMAEVSAIREYDTDAVADYVIQRLSVTLPDQPRRIPLFTRLSVAAVLLLIVAGAWLFITRDKKATTLPIISAVNKPKNDIPPGGNKAILTLADGNTVNLDSAHSGMTIQQGATKVVNLAGGQLSYQGKAHTGGTILYNTVATGRGGQYRLVLSDGTTVWLDASSSLKYPTSFSGASREVVLTGQGYFEVVHQKEPFIVHTQDMDVHDLGTSFNINAYPEEGGIRTTLLQGSVKITGRKASSMLKPGQQALFGRDNDNISVIDDADLDEVMAWKNGRFVFSDMDLKTIMRQLTRWYDVDVVFEGEAPPIRIGGFIHKDVYLSTVMNFLGENGVHYKIEGRKITILQK